MIHGSIVLCRQTQARFKPFSHWQEQDCWTAARADYSPFGVRCFWGWFPTSDCCVEQVESSPGAERLGQTGQPHTCPRAPPPSRACRDLAPCWDDSRGLDSKSEWEACCYFYLLLGGIDRACQELQLVWGESQRIGSNKLWEHVLSRLRLKEWCC